MVAGSPVSDSEIIWQPWKKKFAFFPTKIHNRLVGHNKAWLTVYYERHGQSLFAEYTQRGTILDVLKSN